MTKAVNGVVEGQELWFSNTSFRLEAGQSEGGSYGPGTEGDYWSSTPDGSNAYWLLFYNSYPTGTYSSYNKLYALSVRCVR